MLQVNLVCEHRGSWSCRGESREVRLSEDKNNSEKGWGACLGDFGTGALLGWEGVWKLQIENLGTSFSLFMFWLLEFTSLSVFHCLGTW
jgi:hypothetical protein